MSNTVMPNICLQLPYMYQTIIIVQYFIAKDVSFWFDAMYKFGHLLRTESLISALKGKMAFQSLGYIKA